jgi:hypothetical protein
MFEKTPYQMNNWSWDNPSAFGVQFDPSNLQITHLGKIQATAKRVSWYSSDDRRAKIEPPSFRQYISGDILGVRPLNQNEKMDNDNNDENWTDPRVPSGGRSHASHGNGNNDGEGEEDTPGGEKGTRQEQGTKDGMGKGKGEGKTKGNRIGKGIVMQTPPGDDTSHVVALELWKEMYEAD